MPELNYAGTVYNGIRVENFPFDAEKDDFVLQVTRGFRLLVTSRDRDRVLAEGLGDGKGFDVVMSTARRTRGGRGEHRILKRYNYKSI